MEGLKDYIRSKRKLSENSVNTYYSLLKSLWNKVYGDKQMVYEDFNSDAIYNFVKEHRPKTTIASLCVITENPRMKKLMEEELNKEKVRKSQQQKTEKQEQNWLSATEIKGIFEELKKKVPSWYKTKNLQDIQQYILLALCGGLFINPRRSKDWFDFKIKNIDSKTDNFMIREKILWKVDEWQFDPRGKKEDVFVFNSYKGSDKKGQQVIPVPKELVKILKKWIDANPTEYLLFDRNNSPLTAVKINQRMEKIFGKQASVNLLRHTHLTDKYANIPMNEVHQTMKAMGSSIGMFQEYVLK